VKFEEVLPALRAGKKVIRPTKGWITPLEIKDFISISTEALLENDWEIVEEPKPPKLLAPALYYTGTEWILGRTLFESKKEAREEHGDRQVIWPAIPNKDGYYAIND
jgi:hypothetical protein